MCVCAFYFPAHPVSRAMILYPKRDTSTKLCCCVGQTCLRDANPVVYDLRQIHELALYSVLLCIYLDRCG